MRYRSFCFAAVSLTLAAMPAALAGPIEECAVDRSSQVEIGNCLVDVETRADLALAQALNFAMAAAHEVDDAVGRSVAVPALEASQEAWVAFRDQQCGFVGATFGGGSGTGIGIQGCRIELSRARADALMSFAG